MNTPEEKTLYFSILLLFGAIVNVWRIVLHRAGNMNGIEVKLAEKMCNPLENARFAQKYVDFLKKIPYT